MRKPWLLLKSGRHPFAGGLSWVGAGLLAAGLLIVAGCAQPTRREWLATFFDGVPPLTTNGTARAIPVPAAETAAPAPAPAVIKIKGPVAIMHTPFADNQCGECHESKFSQKLKGKTMTVCFSCHDDFLEKAVVKHTPVESGECLACHSPHQSDFKGLLIKPDPAVCLECHDEADLVKVKGHNKRADLACLPCHQPHAGPKKHRLKTLVAAAPAGGTKESVK